MAIMEYAKTKATVTPDRTISGSYDWLRLGQSVMFATISSSGRIPRSIFTCGHAFTNDWRISMARVIVGNRATGGSDQRSMYDQS